jgi:hypothetical protein
MQVMDLLVGKLKTSVDINKVKEYQDMVNKVLNLREEIQKYMADSRSHIQQLHQEGATEEQLEHTKIMLDAMQSDFRKLKSGVPTKQPQISELDKIINKMTDEIHELSKINRAIHPLYREICTIKPAPASPPASPSPKKKKVWPKGTAEVDIMIYEYELEHSTGDFLFVKVGEGTYKFGTKKITAKVSNGVCLIRVGGGYMDIAEFYTTYSEQEREKLQRYVGMESSPSQANLVEDSLGPRKPSQGKKKKKKRASSKAKAGADEIFSGISGNEPFHRGDQGSLDGDEIVDTEPDYV